MQSTVGYSAFSSCSTGNTVSKNRMPAESSQPLHATTQTAACGRTMCMKRIKRLAHAK